MRVRLHQWCGGSPQMPGKVLFAKLQPSVVAARKPALEAYLVEKNPTIDIGSANGRKAALERARLKHQKDAAYQKLVSAAVAAQVKLEREYPQLFVSDDAIKAKREGLRASWKPSRVSPTAWYRPTQTTTPRPPCERR